MPDALMWRTPSQPQGPTQAEVKLGQRTYTKDGQLVIVSLDRQVEAVMAQQQWQTPATDSFRSRGGYRKDEQGLDQQARLTWQTPHGFANTDRYGKTGGGGGEMAKQCVMWATPQANAEGGSRNCEGSKAHQGTSLADQVTTGSSQTGRAGNTRRLNSRFVLWLMGFCPTWCDEIPRVDALRAAGNAVCPPQGAYAIALLWRELSDYLAQRKEAE